MFKHYLHAAVRSLLHRKLYSGIAAQSLAIGLTVSILILSFLHFENGFDSRNHDSVRINRQNRTTVDGIQLATFVNPISPLLTTALPEIESFTRLARWQQRFTVGEVGQYQQLSMVDKEFFNYGEIAGDPVWAMQQWLANFAYRTDIHIGIFLFAGAATFLLAMFTTFQRAYSVATANPIAALRTE